MEEIFVTERIDASNNEVSDNIQLMNQLRIVALKCLPELISFCSKVKTPSSLLDNPPLFFNDMLQRLEVYGCATFEELIVKEESRSDGEGRNIKFPQLSYLMKECLDNLKRLNAGNYIEFPSLKQMVIGECPEMKAFIFNEELAFPSLEVMSFYRMNNLKMIWHNKLAKDSFMNLKSLSVGKFQQLMTVYPSYMCERLWRLEGLFVDECDSLEEIFDFQGINITEEAHSTMSTPLRTLKLSYLPKLKHEWNLDPKGLFSSQNLCKVEVSYCRAMKNLFPASFSRNDLLQLEQLSVSNSGVEKIFAAKEGAEAETTFVFPRMTHLSPRHT
ncbi:hypothetical protein Ddye_028454 [Dipteronia dyeriana]|uniref:Disease resistance protein At4g27190-like leucine-rich repeats domain-containing protein n=1 Tax=Dipteronia dyeriana TaxID=168575 RepID=A0AAD9TQZ5_9ROSI|nr:hypothetical protein Ddye_028454 [Dipteronia dyeriana]